MPLILASFFAQVHLAIQSFKIREVCQVANLEETALTSARGICNVKRRSAVPSCSNTAAIPRTGTKYPHRISVISAIFASNTSPCTSIILRSKQEPILSNRPVHYKVTSMAHLLGKIFGRKTLQAKISIHFTIRCFFLFLQHMQGCLRTNGPSYFTMNSGLSWASRLT